MANSAMIVQSFPDLQQRNCRHASISAPRLPLCNTAQRYINVNDDMMRSTEEVL